MEEEIGDSNIRTYTMYILYMQHVLYAHTKYVLTVHAHAANMTYILIATTYVSTDIVP